MRIGELAEAAGTTIRNVRFYSQLGILPRPEVRGRTGFYGEEHLRRLALVRRLQDRGYSLAAIADMIDTQIPAVLLDDVDRSDAGTGGWPESGARVTAEQLGAVVPDLAADPSLIDRMLGLGLLAAEDDGTFSVPRPPLLRAGIALVSRGVPVPVALDELTQLRAELGGIAGRFAKILVRDMVPAAAGGGPVPSPEAVLQQVWPSVLVAIGSVLTEEMREAVAAAPRPPAG